MTFAYSLRMRLLTPLVAVTLVALLAACGPDPAPAPLPPEPTASPVFASDAEALAAAEEAYAAYLEMSDLISSEGGADPDRIAPFVALEHVERAESSFGALLERQLRTTGKSSFWFSEVIFRDQTELQVGVCLDISDIAVIDAAGLDVTPASRSDTIALRVLFRMESERILVAGSESAEISQC
jgi:hypothetical protein